MGRCRQKRTDFTPSTNALDVTPRLSRREWPLSLSSIAATEHTRRTEQEPKHRVRGEAVGITDNGREPSEHQPDRDDEHETRTAALRRCDDVAVEGPTFVGSAVVGLVALTPIAMWMWKRLSGSRADAFDRTPDPARTIAERARLSQRSDS